MGVVSKEERRRSRQVSEKKMPIKIQVPPPHTHKKKGLKTPK
jgi:hypothetical protein